MDINNDKKLMKLVFWRYKKLTNIYILQKLGLRPAALAFKNLRPGQKPPQAKHRAWLGLASGLRLEPAHHYSVLQLLEPPNTCVCCVLFAHTETQQRIILAMEKMHAELTAAAENEENLPALWVALSLGKTLLNKYYSLMDDLEVYRIALGV